MTTSQGSALVLGCALGLALGAPLPTGGQESSPTTLTVLTYNVWHGLRSGESNKRFPGEEEGRQDTRVELQVEEIQRLDPDVVFFQEVNPNQPLSRRYARALGYDEIHKVTSCGLHLGALYKIPKNMNEGLAILAKPALGLRRVGKKRLSGNAACSASWGFQTKESRYGLFGVITINGQKMLVATTHLASPAFVPPGFDDSLDDLVQEGVLTADQRGEILAERDRKEDRNLGETDRLLKEIARHRDRLAKDGARPPVILGGDFNAEPEKPGIAAVRAAGYVEVASGPDFHTWDPVVNLANYEIGTKRHYSLPTFDKPQVQALLDQRHDTPRQIDHIFVSSDLTVLEAEMVLEEEQDGLYLSDHFAILVTVELP